MSPEELSLISVGVFLLLVILGIPVAWVLGGLTIFFGYLIVGDNILPWVVLRTWDIMGMFSLMAIPLFILMATVLSYSGIAEDLYEALRVWLGPVPGGLAIASVLAATVLAAMVGIIAAGVVLMGMIALPTLRRYGYDVKLSTGAIMAGGALGVLIPPSVTFIIYGLLAPWSVGQLFIGGIIPGLILSGLFCLYILTRTVINPKMGPPLPKEERTMTLWQKFVLLRGIIMPAVLIVMVLGSIYLGWATPSEAAGVGCIGAIICAAIRGKFTRAKLKACISTTARNVGMIAWITFAAYAFAGIFIYAGGGHLISDYLLGSGLGRWGIVALIMLVLFVLGMFLDTTSIIILCTPVFVPIINELGFHTLWFGVIFNMNLQIAFLSPPFGLCLFFMKGVAPDISMGTIMRSVLPYIGLQIVGLVLVIAFPQLCMYLPSLMIK